MVFTQRVMWCGIVLALAAAARAQTPQVPVAQEAVEFAPTPPYEESVAKERPVWRIGAKEVVDRAFHNNLDLIIERYSQLLARQRVPGALGYYDPVLSLTGAAGRVTNPLTAAPGDTRIPREVVTSSAFTPSIKQNLIGGGSATVALANSQTLSSLTPTINPLFASGFSASVTQPLMRGFGATAIDRQVDSTRLDVQIEDAAYRQKVTFVLQQALSQYWELVFAVESYETRRQSKALALVQYESTKLRVQTGLLTPTALTASRAEIAGRERDMLLARVQIINVENALKLLLSDDPAAAMWSQALIPTDRPEPAAAIPPVQPAVETALAHRPELDQIRFQTQQNRIDRKFYTWEKMPTVNLTGGFTAAGKSGTIFQSVAGSRLVDATNPAFGGYQSSWRQVFGLDFPAWSLGLSVQFPIGNRSADANLVQARLLGDRLQTQMTRTQQGVVVEVRSSIEVLGVQRQSLEAAHLTTQLSQEQLDAQTARFEAGFSSDFELLRYQRDLVDAQVRELRALIDLQQAVLAYEKATDTLIENHGIALAGYR